MKTILFSFIIVSSYSYSQNLVLNPDFELFDYCQERVVPNNPLFQPDMLPIEFYAMNWYIPFFSTPDYYHDSCNEKFHDEFLINTNLNIPKKSGNAFAGFNLFGPDGNFESLTGSLKESLLKDTIYIVSFELCYLKNISGFKCQKIGIKFSQKIQVYPRPLYAKETNYVEMFEDTFVIADHEVDISILGDSVFWQQFSFKYKAQGGEKYLSFGMFYQPNFDLAKYCSQFASFSWNKKLKSWLRNNRNTPILVFTGKLKEFIKLSEVQKRMCYYVIDNVLVEKIPPTGPSL